MSIDTFLLSSDATDLNYPEVRPTLDLNFARVKALDPRITFTRASGGSYVGADGLIKLAGVNEPRFDHDPLTGESLGLLVEEARTNSLWPSEPTTATARNFAGGTGNAWFVYDGTVSSASRNTINGLEVTINSILDNNGFTGGNAASWGGIGGGGIHAFNTNASISFFIHPLTWNGNICLGRLPNDGNNTFAAQNFQIFNNGVYTGPIGNVKAIFPDGTYWLHNINWTSLSTPTAQSQFLVIFTTTPGDNIKKFWAGGFQWEAGGFSTSYIPTVASTRTRAADAASITGTNFSSWYNQSQGSIIIASNRNATDSPPFSAWSFNNNTSAFIYQTRSLFRGGNLGNISVGVSGSRRQAYAYTDQVSVTGVNNGNTPGTVSAAASVVGVSLRIGGYEGYFLNGTISRLTYYPKRLPDAQLQALTR